LKGKSSDDGSREREMLALKRESTVDQATKDSGRWRGHFQSVVTEKHLPVNDLSF